MVRFPSDVQAMIDAGELWRAKQRVEGRIRSSGCYDPDLYEQYGVILMRMGDLVLAGKYLFLSGCRESAYSAAIKRYILQHGRGGWRTMFGTFPSAVRRMPVDDFPQPLRDDYADLRVPRSASAARPEPKGLRYYMALTGCGLVILLLVAIFSAGTRAIFHEIAQWLR
jgi:hypothetical protein